MTLSEAKAVDYSLLGMTFLKHFTEQIWRVKIYVGVFVADLGQV